MKGLGSQRGFTMFEAVISLAITGLLMSILATSFFLLSQTPAQLGDQLTAMEDLRFASRWLTRDGSMAQSFTAGSSPDYGSFSWTDYTAAPPVTRTVTYTYSGTQLLRKEYQGSNLVSTQAVARNIGIMGDVGFQYTAASFIQNATTGLWSLIGGIVTATLTSTVRFTGDPTDQVISTTVVSQLRAQSERSVNEPGPTPTPAPGAGEVTYYCGSLNLIQGSLVSGGCAQLGADDTSYYVVNSSTGSNKLVTWEITSQPITFTTIASIDITFVARSSQTGVLEQLFVYNPTDPTHTDGGYHPSVADQGFTYTQNNVDKSVTFPMDAADVAYVDSLITKTVKIKAKASGNANFTISTDQFIFRVR